MITLDIAAKSTVTDLTCKSIRALDRSNNQADKSQTPLAKPSSGHK